MSMDEMAEEREEKAEQLAQLKAAWDGCRKCGLCNNRRNMVFGEGNPGADILIVGEGPGAEEDRSGRPFYGESGAVLDRFLDASGLSRTEDIYVTNLVCCRPTTETQHSRTKEMVTENRPPSKEERAVCWPRVRDTIYIVDPLVIVALGKTALSMMTGRAATMSKIRGEMQTMHMMGGKTEVRYPVLPLYHPAFLLRTMDTSDGGPWGQTGQDFSVLCHVIDYLREKYRGLVTSRFEEKTHNESKAEEREDEYDEERED
jgi:DNA polymerase